MHAAYGIIMTQPRATRRVLSIFCTERDSPLKCLTQNSVQLFTWELFGNNHTWRFVYRSRATAGRSRLVAAPLSFQAKNRFLCAFYVAI